MAQARGIRLSVRWPADRCTIMDETPGEFSGLATKAITDRPMANPALTLRSREQLMSIIPIHMTFPGIGRTDIRRLWHRPTEPMCRNALRRPSQFPVMTAQTKPSISCVAIEC